MANKFTQFIELALQDKQFESGVKSATDQVKKLQKEVSATKGHANNVTGAFKAMRAGVGGVVDAAFSLKSAIVGAVAAFGVSRIIAAAEKQENAVIAVANAMQLTGEFSQAALKDMEAFAAQLQTTTGVTDQTTLQMVALAKSFGASNDQAKQMTQAAVELSAATGKSLDESIQLVAKTLGGYSGELGEVNPAVKALTQEQLKAGDATKILLDQFGGSAASKLQTFAGAMTATQGRFTDLLESIGDLIIKNPVVVATVNELGAVFKTLNASLKNNATSIQRFISQGLKTLLASLPATLRGFAKFAQTLSVLGELNPFASLTTQVSSTNKTFNESLSLIEHMTRGLVIMAQTLTNILISIKQLGNKAANFFGFGDVADVKNLEEVSQKLKDIRGDIERVGSERQLGLLADGAVDLKDKIASPVDGLIAQVQKFADSLDKIPDTVKTDVEVNQTIKRSIQKPKEEQRTFAIEIQKSIENAFPDSKELSNDLRKRMGDTGASILGSLAQSISQGKEGAKQFVSSAAGAIGDFFLPGISSVITPLVSFLAQGPDVAKAQINAFIDGIPDVIEAIVEAIPVVMQALADKADVFISALAMAAWKVPLAMDKAMPMVARELVLQIAENLKWHLNQIGEVFTHWREEIEKIFAPLTNIVGNIFNEIGNALGKFPQALADGAKNFISTLLQAIGSIAGKLNPFSGGGGGGTLGQIVSGAGNFVSGLGSAVGLATGASVKGFGNRDTVPALLSPGELVVDRTTGPRLNKFMDDYANHQSQPASSGVTEVLLTRILEAVQTPQQVSTKITIDSRVLGDAILDLTKRNARLGI